MTISTDSQQDINKDDQIRWNIRRRLERIDLLLMWDGKINRSNLTEFFGISEPQASSDLTKYREFAPGNLVYDPSEKCYVSTDKFEPYFVQPNANRYLNQLRLIAADVIRPMDAWFHELPSFDALISPGSDVEPGIFQAIQRAIRRTLSVEIRYQSMSRPQPIWRRVSPHALGFDGRRWHIRCYCHIRNDFRDFLFSRILGHRSFAQSEFDPKDDSDWNEEIDIVVIPHRKLKPAQQKIIQRDYGMRGGKLKIRVRRAMLFYLINHLKLDTGKYKLKPKEIQIELLNEKSILNMIN